MMALNFDHNLLKKTYSHKGISIFFQKQSKNKTINADLIGFYF